MPLGHVKYFSAGRARKKKKTTSTNTNSLNNIPGEGRGVLDKV